MFVAHFSAKDREPERMYFTYGKREPEEVLFKGERKPTIKFIINKSMDLEVRSD